MRFIFTADWHLRGDRPRCRLDSDWLDTQRQVIRFIGAECERRNCHLIIGGDIFHTPRIIPDVLNLLISELKEAPGIQRVHMMAGNHDLKYHLWENVESSSYGTLRHIFSDITEAGSILSVHGAIAFKFGQEEGKGERIVFTHQLVFPDEKAQPMPDIGKTAEQLLSEFPRAEWIFCGDYHHAFHFQKTQTKKSTGERITRHVVNPGCITRQVADMADYLPQIFFIDTEIGEVTPIILPDVGDLVTDEYLRKEEERDERIEAFLSLIGSSESASLSFRDNLVKRLESPDIRPGVKYVAQSILEELCELAGT